MAHGYYMATGRVQAVMVHVGLGTANSINGLYNAARQNVPILFSAGRTPLLEGGLPGSRNNYINWAQEMFDQAGMVRELVKWEYELRHPLQLETVVDRALALATSEPQGPVYLTLPREVLAAASHGHEPGVKTSIAAATPAQADSAALAQLAGWLRAARAPLIITSDAGRKAGAAAALGALAQRYALPVVQYRPRFLCLPLTHEMHCGFDATPLLPDADLVLVLESDVPWIPDQVAPNAACKVVHLGVDPLYARYPIRGFRADLTITGEPVGALAQLDLALQKVDAGFKARIDARRTTVADFRKTHGLPGARMTQAPATMSAKWVTRCIDDICDADTVLLNEYPLVLEELTRIKPGNYYLAQPGGRPGLGHRRGAGVQAGPAGPDVDRRRRRRRLHVQQSDARALCQPRGRPAGAGRDFQQSPLGRGAPRHHVHVPGRRCGAGRATALVMSGALARVREGCRGERRLRRMRERSGGTARRPAARPPRDARGEAPGAAQRAD